MGAHSTARIAVSRGATRRQATIDGVNASGADSDTPVLSLLAGDGTSRVTEVYPLRSRDHLVGRAEWADVVLVEASVSREHLRVQQRAQGWVAIGLSPSNPLYVEGRAVEQVDLRDGMVLEVGDLRLRFDLHDPQSRATVYPQSGAAAAMMADAAHAPADPAAPPPASVPAAPVVADPVVADPVPADPVPPVRMPAPHAGLPPAGPPHATRAPSWSAQGPQAGDSEWSMGDDAGIVADPRADPLSVPIADADGPRPATALRRTRTWPWVVALLGIGAGVALYLLRHEVADWLAWQLPQAAALHTEP